MTLNRHSGARAERGNPQSITPIAKDGFRVRGLAPAPRNDTSRRAFITLVGGAAAWPLTARAQQPAMPLVGLLESASPPEPDRTHRLTAFHHGMKEIGYVDGQNVAIEYRSGEGQTGKLRFLVADLLRQRAAVIVGNTPSALAAKAATTAVPIIFVSGSDPVRGGLVASINRPGGNVTGISFLSEEVGAKQLGLLRELRPGAGPIAVLADPKWPLTEGFVSRIRAAALVVGQQLIVLDVGSDREIETAFATLVHRGAGALLVGTGIRSHRERIAALAARHAIPAIYSWREAVAAGGLMSYAPSMADAYRQGGVYAGRILKGEKPGDLPVLLPTKFEFVINLKTAKALGLEVPNRLLIAADEVIE
jgi:putative tryptophan/tyrosine transport system substrate-binding protein